MVLGFPLLAAENACRVRLFGNHELERPAEGSRLVGILALVKDKLLLEELCATTVYVNVSLDDQYWNGRKTTKCWAPG